jgi:hypothetical protein
MICPESGFRYRLEQSAIRSPQSAIGTLRCLDLPEDTPLPESMTKGRRTYNEFKKTDRDLRPLTSDL